MNYLDEINALADGLDANGDGRDDGLETEALADGHRATDAGNAARLAALTDGRIRFVHAWQKWIVYRSGVWDTDHGDALIGEHAKYVAREMFHAAASLDHTERDRMLRWARRSEAASSVAAMVRLARGIPGVIVDHPELDAHSWLLNVTNGTIDLRTGELRPHRADDLFTKQAPVAYQPAAHASLWAACVECWQPDPTMRGYLQRVVGSAATGHPVEHLFVNIGGGANGKSVFYGALQRVLGPYAVVPDRSLFVLTRHEPHPTVRADLFGARMLLAPETEAGAQLAESQVKEITGSDRMTGRRMREDPWGFWPTWTAFLHTNHRPAVRGTDDGIWRRLRIIPWDVVIPSDQRDPYLASKLADEAPGILRWMVEGALDWQAQGFDEPEQVRSASHDYRAASDTTARFLDEADLTIKPDSWTPSADLVAAHERWCEDSGLKHPEQWQLTSEGLKRLGAVPRKRAGQRGWEGICGRG
jgi:putative DNA primase/helicase